MNTSGISLHELLTDNRMSAEKWHSWFHANQASLDLPCDIYNSGTVRGLLKHIFAVELRHSQRLVGTDVTAYDAIPTGSLDDLFRVHTQAIKNLEHFLSNTNDAEMREIIPLQTVSAGTLHASRRKLFAHVLLHSIRHWAQLSTLLRSNGFTPDWPKDFLFSEAIR